MTAAAIRRELANLGRMVPGEEATPPSPPTADESMSLARELGASFGEMVKCYREMSGLSPQEALARASETHPTDEERILRAPPDQLSWSQLDTLAERDPELARRLWEEVKREAREELQSGHRAALAMGYLVGDCWPRAQFLAVRAALAEGLRPRNGLEWLLIDTMAQAQTLLLLWQENLAGQTLLAARARKPDPDMPRHPLGRRLTAAEMREEAAAMVERWQRQFLKALEAYQRQRRQAPAVIVRNAGQVNVGGQQVNVAGTPAAVDTAR
jgi:hypothetical protein